MDTSVFDNKFYSTALYKQKYFCQICNRQCKDKDGFNCHLKSNTHRINMEMVSQNPEKFINLYSQEFEKGFMDIIKRNYCGIFISANKIYQDYISDKFATHLNATKWTSLTGFLKSLEKRGICELKANEKEILIMYDDKNPNEKYKIEKKNKEADIEEKKRNQDLDRILQKANLQKNEIKKEKEIETEILTHVDPEKLKNFSIEFKDLKENDIKVEFLNKKREKEEIVNEKFSLIDDPWLDKGLIVRIKDKDLPYFNKKARIYNIIENFLAEVEVLHEKDVKLKIDQAYLEPITPESGKIQIIFGKYKGHKGKLINLSRDHAKILLDDKNTISINSTTLCKYDK